ncbi:MAG: orotidine-5'-phosphate decarboxylase [Chthoniobacterales bacterium]
MKLRHTPENGRERLIVALDFADSEQALTSAQQLADEISWFKIGLQLYTAEGPQIVRAIRETGARVFLDLKLHDIPNTVAGAVTAAARLGVGMLTVHLSGGRKMLEAAVAACPPDLLLLGVTVLTSSDKQTLLETGVASTVADQTMRLAELGVAAGIRGFIASPQEVGALRGELGRESTLITPGVRPIWAEANDQKRFATPREAIMAGADYLVVGRPITAHHHPREAVSQILDEIGSG